MATLADSFLDDLDELGESSDEETQEEGGERSAGGAQRQGEAAEGSNGMEVQQYVQHTRSRADGKASIGRTRRTAVGVHSPAAVGNAMRVLIGNFVSCMQ